jgi:chemotaxis protein MotB
MPPPPPPKSEEDGEDWLVTYADAITLLMAFFVMLVSFSKIDIALYEKVAAGIAREIGGSDIETPVERLKVDVQDIVYSMEADEVVKVSTDEKGVVIEMDSSAFYQPGSADIREEAIPLLERTFKALMAPSYSNFMIEVEGHTDDDPISTAKFPSNWELSAGRASAVVRYYESQGMTSTRLKAIGYAATQPKVPNRDESGAPIPENMAANRRVVLRAFPVLREIIEIPTFRRNQPPESKAPEITTPESMAPESDAAPATETPN